MERERDEDELRLTLLLTELLAEQRERVLVDPNWAEEDRILAEELYPPLLEVALREALRTMRNIEAQKQDGLFDRVVSWLRRYVFDEFVPMLNQSTRDKLAAALEQYVDRTGMTLGELNEAIGFIFTPERANTIAVTELTRAYGEGVKATAEELNAAGARVHEIWVTNNDDLVCDECGPLDNTQRGEDWESYPPMHPNCRCDVRLEAY